MSEQQKITSNINISGARLIFKNFQGKRTDFNDEGNRTSEFFLMTTWLKS